MSKKNILPELKENVALSHRVLYHFGMIQNISLALGHVSGRIPGTDRLVCTPRDKSDSGLIFVRDMKSSQLITVNLDGEVVASPSKQLGTFGEIRLHTEILKARPDIGSVVHAHLRYAGLLTVLNKPIYPMMIEGSELFLKPIRIYNREGDRLYWIGSKEIAEGLRESGGYAVIHRGHGTTVVGETVQQATINTLLLEEHARMNYLAYQVAGFDHPHLSEDYVKASYNLPSTPERRGAASQHGKRRLEVPYTHTPGGIWEALKAELSVKTLRR